MEHLSQVKKQWLRLRTGKGSGGEDHMLITWCREPASVQEVVQQIQDSANDNGVLLFTAITTDLKWVITVITGYLKGCL